MDLETSSFETLALTCHNERCPTLYRDPATGRVGVRGYDSGGETESIVWMEPGQWDLLRGTSGA